MKLTRSIFALTALMAGAANGALLVHYTFDNGDAANSGTLADGTVSGGSTFVPSTAGSAAGMAWQGDRGTTNNARIDTGLTGTDLAMGAGGNYTTMAWVSWDGGLGQVDHMVFGQNDANDGGNSPQLHHGIRDDSVNNGHFGHWGNDVGDAGAVPSDGTWVHMAFTYDSTGGGAEVFLNGVSVGTNAGAGPLNNPALEVIIGAHTRDGSVANPFHSFNGRLDEVRIYDEVLTAAEITNIANAVNIPEPSSLGLLALASLGLVRRRR